MADYHSKKLRACYVLIPLLVAYCNGWAQARQLVTIKGLQKDMVGIASDKTEGRFTGSAGFMRAAVYVVAQLKKVGLQPGWVDEKGKKVFFQPVPFIRDSYQRTSLTVSQKDGCQVFRHSANDFVVVHPFLGQQAGMQAPVFIGYGIEEPLAGWDDYAGVGLAGRWVVMQTGIPPDSLDQFPTTLRKKYEHPEIADSLKYRALLKHQVAGVILLPGTYIAENWETTSIRQYRFGYMHYAGAGDHYENEELVMPCLLISPKAARYLFNGESYDPTIGKGHYHSFVLTNSKLLVKIHHARELVLAYNIIAVSPGTDSLLQNQAIIVGAHLDHIGRFGKHIYNGANDDGSGCAAVLAAAKAIAANPTKRPVLFIFYTGEELNLIGSKHFIDHPPLPLEHIYMDINLEQVGSRHRSFNGIWAVGAEVFKEAFFTSGASFAGAELKYDPTSNWLNELSNTDSYPFIIKNIPSLLLSSGGFDEHHTPMDKIDLIDFEHLQKTAQLLATLLEELGNH